MIPAFLARWLGKPKPVNPGRELAMIRVRNERALFRAKAREMRAALGLPALAALEDR